MITLSKEDTYKIISESKRTKAINKKYKYTTKTRWKCLSCGCTIFVSYRQYGRNAIFCEECWKTKSNNPTIVQFQYVKKLKDYQLRLMEKFLDIDNFDEKCTDFNELKNIEKQLNTD